MKSSKSSIQSSFNIKEEQYYALESICSRLSSRSFLLLLGRKFRQVTQGKRSRARVQKLPPCSTYELNVNSGIGASTVGLWWRLYSCNFFRLTSKVHAFFSLSLLLCRGGGRGWGLGKRVERTRASPRAAAIRRVFLRSRWFSPFTAETLLLLPVGIIRLRPFVLTASSVATEIAEPPWKRAHLLVPSRYLMVRVKSPITQLPRRVYACTNTQEATRVYCMSIKVSDLTA